MARSISTKQKKNVKKKTFAKSSSIIARTKRVEPILAIVKRRGHTENYDERKVYASVYAAALCCHYTETQSERIANAVTSSVTQSAKKHRVLQSSMIRAIVLDHITDKEVKLMYKHHLDVC